MTLLPLAFAALLAGPAHATRVKVDTVPCPLGEGPVKVYEKLVSNTLGGFDSDLAAYSSEGQFRQFAVSTCPDNLLSLYGPDMRKPLDEAQAAAARAALGEVLPTLPPAPELQVWDRYRIAAAVYRGLGRDELQVAEVLLQASWTARDAAVGVYRALEGPVVARQLLDGGRAELEKGLTDDQRRTVLFNLARIAHRGGYVAERDDLLARLEATPGLTDRERAAVATLRAHAAIEASLQDRAIVAFAAGLRAEGVDLDTKIRATYLLADLLRRRGRGREALPLYTRVLSEAQAPLNLREMAGVLHKELTDAGVGRGGADAAPR